MKSFGFGLSGIVGGGSLLLLLLIGFVGQSHEDRSGLQEKKASQASAKHHASIDQTGEVQESSIGNGPATVEEARIRARILHQAFAGALRVMHRDYFREDQKLTLPSKSLDDVFADMAETHQIELRWLAVNANAMSIDHQPQNQFEKQVVKALSSGEDEFEFVSEESFHYAGSIPLSASCVKCHVRSRSSNAAKKAALVISIPLRQK